MAEEIEIVTHLITRYALFESVYFHDAGESRAADVVKPPLIRLYAAILRYLSQAKQYYGRSTGGTVTAFHQSN
jgi:hypothetical protein